jgi:aryl-alcohol dehydrogenase-like predicted oxidoreductase
MNNPQAQRIAIGRTDLQVSPLGIGTNRWGVTRLADPGLQPTFEAALAEGINFFDTAEIYGLGGSEGTLGQFLPSAGPKAVIATKFLPFPWRLRKSSLTAALRASLARLRLAQVDLYLIHVPLPPITIETWMDALAEAVDAGLVRAVGVSNFSAEQTRRAHAALKRHGIPLACNQVEYSLLKRNIERNGVLEACREIGATVVAYRPISGGLLTGRYTPENPPGRQRWRVYSPEHLTRIRPVIDLLGKIGEAHGGKTPSQVALNWTMCKGTLPIPGATQVRHLREDVGALGWRLADGEVESLDEATDRLRMRGPRVAR